MKGCFALLFVLVAAVCATRFFPEPKPHHLNGWRRIGRTHSSVVLDIHVALSRPFSHVTSELYQISNPDHPRYGNHHNVESVKELTRPEASGVRRVLSFFSSHNVSCSFQEGHSDWLSCPGVAVSHLESALMCEFYDFVFPGSRHTLSRTASYSLPSSLAGVVDMIGGIKRLPNIRHQKKLQRRRRSNSPRQDGFVTPQRSRALWQVTGQGSRVNKNLQEVAQFLDQYMTMSDLTSFWSQLSLPSVNVTINGPNDPTNPGAEASLDIQTITGVNQGTATWFTVTPGLHKKQEPFLVWLLLIAGQKVNANVHSVSYGDDEDSLDSSYLTRVDQEFQKLGLQGHTFVFASGDSGVDCDRGKQKPDFPASSPHVLTVGGVVDQGTPVPRSWSGSGGGFSNFFTQPSFMNAAHSAYLNNPANHIPPSKTFNHTGRGYPDVSAVAMNVLIVMGGQEVLVGGTSCAAPVVAGILSMLNDVRIANKKPILGYVVPLFYNSAFSSGFIPIVSGPANSAGSCQGFEPAKGPGWSPITGFGGLNFANLKKLV